jgi:hypothetical protein
MVGKLTKDDTLSASTTANALGKGKYKSQAATTATAHQSQAW